MKTFNDNMPRKSFLNRSMLLVCSMLYILLFVACGDDDSDDEGGSKSNSFTAGSVVGMWSTSRSSNNTLWIFEADKTGTLYEHYDNEDKGAEKSTFTYGVNEQMQTISIKPIESENELTAQDIRVISSSEGTLVVTQHGNEQLMLKRQSKMPTIFDKPVPKTFLLDDTEKSLNFYATTCYLSVENLDDDNDFQVASDVSWLKEPKLTVGNQYENSSIGKYRYIGIEFSSEKNLERVERDAVVTITKKATGENYSFTVTQKPYVSFEVSGEEFEYMGGTFEGMYLNSSGSDGKVAFSIYLSNFENTAISMALTSNWISLVEKKEITGWYGETRYSYDFSIQPNTHFDRKMQIIFYNANKDSYVLTIIQEGRHGPQGGYSGDGDCPHCSGSGVCSYCDGKGILWGYGQNGVTCPKCNGSKQCKWCDGTGWKPDTGTVDTGDDDNGGGYVDPLKCRWCNGTGKCRNAVSLSKYYCGGSGKCKWCGGDGWYYGVAYKKMMCTACNKPGNNSKGIPGDGKCAYCSGDGRCSHCGGTGKP